MTADRIDIDAVLDRWRATGADRVDPLRFHRIAALQRRAAARDGVAREALDATMSRLIDAYAAQLGARPAIGHDADAGPSRGDDAMQAGLAAPPVTVRGPARSALGRLVDAMTARASTDGGNITGTPQRADYPELPALEDFRQLWSTLRTGSQVRLSLIHI